MDWLVTIAKCVAASHSWIVRVTTAIASDRSPGVSAAIAGAPYAFETLFCCWFVLTFCMGIRAQREYMRPKPPPKPSSDSLDRIILPDGKGELWAEFDKWGRKTGDWLRPPPPPTATAQVEVVKDEDVVKQKPKFVVGGREV